MLAVPTLGFSQKRKQKQANEETAQWRYEIEFVQQGKEEVSKVVIKVWSYSSKVEIAQKQAAKNGVHAVMFKGVPGKGNIQPKPALVDSETEMKYKEFFKEFFKDGGEYMRYVQLTTNGIPNTGDILKTSKKEYKVGIIVTIDYAALEKMLKDKGINKKLSDIFK